MRKVFVLVCLFAVGRPYGMILVTGPTGSGKTVSLYTCLSILNQPGVNIATAEDPAEIMLPGVNQVNVNEKAGLTFASGLRSMIRSDPDVLLVSSADHLLTIDERTIPIDRIGLLDIPLGEATLPNGILTEASFEFVETWPADVALAGGSGVLGIRSLETDGKPFDNYYLHGWRPGLERVAVTLQLEVLYFEPGADLVIRDVVVR